MNCGDMIDDVGPWAADKHEYLQRYIEISRCVRRKWQPPEGAGATYIDLFCGSGKCRVRSTGEIIDGSPIVAWRASRNHAPFTTMYIADIDTRKRRAAAQRLRDEGAPVVEIEGDALEAIEKIVPMLDQNGLHFAFLDPYSLGALDFRIIERLSTLKRIDMLIHISKMDLQRNLPMNIRDEHDAFDRFAPGWHEHIAGTTGDQHKMRGMVVEYWRSKVAELNVWTSPEMELITGDRGQHLYWLLLAYKHRLAGDFWKKTGKRQQLSFDF